MDKNCGTVWVSSWAKFSFLIAWLNFKLSWHPAIKLSPKQNFMVAHIFIHIIRQWWKLCQVQSWHSHVKFQIFPIFFELYTLSKDANISKEAKLRCIYAATKFLHGNCLLLINAMIKVLENTKTNNTKTCGLLTSNKWIIAYTSSARNIFESNSDWEKMLVWKKFQKIIKKYLYSFFDEL